jgi:hypothetical protein
MRVLAFLLLTTTAFAEGDLYIYSWGEYTPPDMVAKFEAEFGVKVHIDSYDSMETMIAKLRAGGAGYDIIVPGDATMQVLIAEGMVEEIDVFAMPNFASVDDRWREVYWDPKCEYSAPLGLGVHRLCRGYFGRHRGLFVLGRPLRPGRGRERPHQHAARHERRDQHGGTLSGRAPVQ